MGREGFEPSKASPTDLQSAPFDRSGISPVNGYVVGRYATTAPFLCQVIIDQAICRTRTDDLEITSHVLCQLS